MVLSPPRPRPPKARLAVALLAVVVAACAACKSGDDPNLKEPCAARAAREVVVGTGEQQFTAVDPSGVLIETGPQGGNHIWIALQCQNLGPKVTAKYGVRDADTGEDLTLTGLESVIELTYSGEGDEASGIYGYLDGRFVQQLPGKKVVMWAKVTDDCKVEGSGETKTVVKGFR